MLRWLRLQSYDNVYSYMKKIYKKKLLPLETLSLYNRFHSPELTDGFFDAKPIVLFLGQYSTGKTTFIRNLVGSDIPGSFIGPEPTTDSFMIVMNKETTTKDRIPGNVLVMDPNLPFKGLEKFGNRFFRRCQLSFVESPFLSNVTLVDTPGILSGEKQSLHRGYDFPEVVRWFAEYAAKVIIMFDAHKLDISDELKRCIDILKGQEEKICILLNKADMVDHFELVNIYGSLMWSLGKIIHTPETAKVYIGSFWDRPIQQEVHKKLFEESKLKVYEDLESLPKSNTLRKTNDLMKRARLVKAHALIMSYCYKESQHYYFFSRKNKAIANLRSLYDIIEAKHSVDPQDLPDITKMKVLLEELDFSKLNRIKTNYIEKVDAMFSKDISKLLNMVHLEDLEEFKRLKEIEVKEVAEEMTSPIR